MCKLGNLPTGNPARRVDQLLVLGVDEQLLDPLLASHLNCQSGSLHLGRVLGQAEEKRIEM